MKYKEILLYVAIICIAIAYQRHRTTVLLQSVSDLVNYSLESGVEIGYDACESGIPLEDVTEMVRNLRPTK